MSDLVPTRRQTKIIDRLIFQDRIIGELNLKVQRLERALKQAKLPENCASCHAPILKLGMGFVVELVCRDCYEEGKG